MLFFFFSNTPLNSATHAVQDVVLTRLGKNFVSSTSSLRHFHSVAFKTSSCHVRLIDNVMTLSRPSDSERRTKALICEKSYDLNTRSSERLIKALISEKSYDLDTRSSELILSK